MRTAGIDLATADANTAVCVLDWSETGVCVDFRDDASNDGLIKVRRDVAIDKVGIDCPFGWPAPFVAAPCRGGRQDRPYRDALRTAPGRAGFRRPFGS